MANEIRYTDLFYNNTCCLLNGFNKGEQGAPATIPTTEETPFPMSGAVFPVPSVAPSTTAEKTEGVAVAPIAAPVTIRIKGLMKFIFVT